MKPNTIQPASYPFSPLKPNASVAVPLAVALPRKTAVLTPLDVYDGTTGTLGSATSVSTSASASPRNEAMASGWRTVGHVLLASLVGVPVGLMAGEWSWRERPNSLAKKLAENKQGFLGIVKTPLSEEQLKNIGKIGGLASTYCEVSPTILDEIRTLLQEKELEAFTLHELERLLEVDESKLQTRQIITENVMVVTEESPKRFLTWLRKSEKELRKMESAWLQKIEKDLPNMEVSGQLLSQAARQSKWVAGGVAGGIIGAGMLLLTLWHPKSNKATPVLPPASASDGKEVESDPLPTEPLLPSEITTEAGSIQTVEERPTTETVQAFWEKQRKH